MGIKPRMIDKDRKPLFTFFPKCLKMYGFILHMHAKFAKSAIMISKYFPPKNINVGIQKRKILCFFKFVDTDFKNAP
jgi:hypothetical protein